MFSIHGQTLEQDSVPPERSKYSDIVAIGAKDFSGWDSIC